MQQVSPVPVDRCTCFTFVRPHVLFVSSKTFLGGMVMGMAAAVVAGGMAMGAWLWNYAHGCVNDPLGILLEFGIFFLWDVG